MLFDTFASHALQLANHMVMAPLTRSRATPEHTPDALMATCYGQRQRPWQRLPLLWLLWPVLWLQARHVRRIMHSHPQATTMALDGIHPSSDGYAAWADGLSLRILADDSRVGWR